MATCQAICALVAFHYRGCGLTVSASWVFGPLGRYGYHASMPVKPDFISDIRADMCFEGLPATEEELLAKRPQAD